MSENLGVVIRIPNPDIDANIAYLVDLDELKLLKKDGEEISEILNLNKGGDTPDINFTGSVSAGGYAGVNQRVTIGDKKLTFKQGICIAIEDV